MASAETHGSSNRCSLDSRCNSALHADLLIAEHAKAEARTEAAERRLVELRACLDRVQHAYVEQATRNEKLASTIRNGTLMGFSWMFDDAMTLETPGNVVKPNTLGVGRQLVLDGCPLDRALQIERLFPSS